jgi:glycosyltransferase involved in cell wall biosynthesis
MKARQKSSQALEIIGDSGRAVSDLSIVIPMFNEAAVLQELFSRLEKVVASLGRSTELVLIDDGSTDSTWLDINAYQPVNFVLRCIALSRNFGKEAALTCGLKAAEGRVIAILDADCQDPPELLPQMLAAWDKGTDVVNMKRRSRQGESWFKRKSSVIYYRLLSSLAEITIPENVGDFRLLSRRVVDEVNRLGENNRYMKGILAWPGFDQVTIEYDREPRNAGTSKWNYWQLFHLSVSGITSFSIKPLRIASWLGTMVALSAFLYGIWVLVRTLMYGDPVSGYPSLMLVILFLGGIQLTTIGVLGEYVGRIYAEVKNRPNYIVRDTRTIESEADGSLLRSRQSRG